MKLKDLISDLSLETGVPAGQVRKVANALTRRLQVLIEQQEGFRSGDLVFRPVTLPAKPASDVSSGRSERKIARVLVRPRKPKGEGNRQVAQDLPQG